MLLVKVHICWNRVDATRHLSLKQAKHTNLLIDARTVQYNSSFSTFSGRLSINTFTATMCVWKGSDGRNFHTSNTGVNLVESGESEEKLPPHPSATT